MNWDLPEVIAERAYAQLKAAAIAMEAKLLQGLREALMGYDLDAGTFKDTKRNERLLAGLNVRVLAILKEAGYEKAITEYLSNFDELNDWNVAVHAELSGLKVSRRLLDAFKRRGTMAVRADLLGEALIVNVGRSVMDIVAQRLYAGGGISDAIRALEQELLSIDRVQNGLAPRLGALTAHVTTIGRDAILQYHGTVNGAIQAEYRLDAIRYIGSLVRDSRPQCKRWVRYDKNGERGIIKYVDLYAEIEYSFRHGKGMIRSTTPENFCRNRGGYGCRHTAIPVRL